MADPKVLAWLHDESDDSDPPPFDYLRMLQHSLQVLNEATHLENIAHESDHSVLESLLQRMQTEPEDGKRAYGKAGAKAHGKADAKGHGKPASKAYGKVDRKGHTGYKPGMGKSFSKSSSKSSGQSARATSAVGRSDNLVSGSAGKKDDFKNHQLDFKKN